MHTKLCKKTCILERCQFDVSNDSRMSTFPIEKGSFILRTSKKKEIFQRMTHRSLAFHKLLEVDQSNGSLNITPFSVRTSISRIQATNPSELSSLKFSDDADRCQLSALRATHCGPHFPASCSGFDVANSTN